MYNLRGRGVNNSLGSGESNTQIYGPFVSYQDENLPSFAFAQAHPVGPDAIDVIWGVQSSSCYSIGNITVNCGTVMAPRGEGISQLVIGLEPDTEYVCTVSGIMTENSPTVDTPRIRELVTVNVTATTLPRGKYYYVGVGGPHFGLHSQTTRLSEDSNGPSRRCRARGSHLLNFGQVNMITMMYITIETLNQEWCTL